MRAQGRFQPDAEMSEFSQQALLCRQDSERWFPEVAHNIVHQTLAMAGEVGEVANIIKKLERGSLNIQDASVRLQLAQELTDVYIYLLNISGLLNVDLSKMFHTVRAENEKRFGPKSNEKGA